MNKFLIIALAVVLAFAGQASAQLTLNSPWAANNGQAGVMFDVHALSEVDITGFEHNLDAGVWDIEIYAHTAGGSYVGDEGNAAAWTLILTDTGLTGLGVNLPGVSSSLTTAMNLPAGATQGFYITCTNGTGMNYQNGSAPGSVHAGDSFVEILEGHGMVYPFAGFFLPRNFSGAMHYTPVSAGAIDLAVVSVDAPNSDLSCGYPLQNETVTMTVQNMGSDPINIGDVIQMNYMANDGVAPWVVTENHTLTAEILPLGTLSYSFTALVDLSSAHAWTIECLAIIGGDGNAGNNLMAKSVSNGQVAITSYPWFDDMDSAGPSNSNNPPTGWLNSQTDNAGNGYSDWYARNTASTPSSGTGPLAGDHTSGSGYYMYIEDSTSPGGDHAAINLHTPCLDLSSLNSPVMKFWLCSFSGANQLYVDVIDGSGTYNFAAVGFGSNADQGWYEMTVDLSAYAGQIIQVVFSCGNANGNFNSDVCIDDVTVYEPVALNGQAAQAGLAEFDINGATNANGDAVSLYTSGPHSSSVTSGSAANIDITGVAGGHPIIVLAGPVNIAAGSIAGIGQFDIGVPSGGPVPAGLSIVVDGTSTAGGGFWSSIFNTGASGTMSLSISFNAPAGVAFGMQAAVFNGGSSVISLSNAVSVTSM